MTTLQVRIDEKTKNASKKIFEDLGIDMSSAVKLYLRQVVVHQGIPFKIVTENGLTLEEEDRILLAAKEGSRGENVKKFVTKKEAIDYLKSL